LALYLTKHHAIKTYWRLSVRGYIQKFPD